MANPLDRLREFLFGRRDLGAGRVDEATQRLLEESEQTNRTIQEIVDSNDPLATLVRNMKSSRRPRSNDARPR